MANVLKRTIFNFQKLLFQFNNPCNSVSRASSYSRKGFNREHGDALNPNFRKKLKIPKHRKMPLFAPDALDLAPKLGKRPKQKFKHFLVLDFEATCDSPLNFELQEIIEFPVLKVNSDTFEIESTFHSYVRPELNPILTPFCTELTGVIQSMVDSQPLFKDVFMNFQKWMESENILRPDNSFAFVTCGDPDFDYLLPIQCYISGLTVPPYMRQWINVKRSFCEISPYTWPDNLVAMLKMCGIEHSGELHSGIDDAKNIVKIMADLADRGLVFKINGKKNFEGSGLETVVSELVQK